MLFRTLAIVFVCCASFVVTPTSRAALLPFHDDFNDGDATDGMPGTWIEGFGGNWDATSGDLTVTHAHGEQPYTYMYVQELTGLRDVSIRTALRFTQLTGARDFADVWARSPGTDFGSYWGGIQDDGLLGIGREDIDGSVVIFNTVSTSLDPVSKDVSIRLDVIGNTISLFAWQSGDPLPDSPLLTAHDNVFAEGGLMGVAYQPNVLGGTSAGSVAFRYFTVVPEPSTIALMSAAVAAICGGVIGGRR